MVDFNMAIHPVMYTFYIFFHRSDGIPHPTYFNFNSCNCCYPGYRSADNSRDYRLNYSFDHNWINLVKKHRLTTVVTPSDQVQADGGGDERAGGAPVDLEGPVAGVDEDLALVRALR